MKKLILTNAMLTIVCSFFLFQSMSASPGANISVGCNDSNCPYYTSYYPSLPSDPNIEPLYFHPHSKYCNLLWVYERDDIYAEGYYVLLKCPEGMIVDRMYETCASPTAINRGLHNHGIYDSCNIYNGILGPAH